MKIVTTFFIFILFVQLGVARRDLSFSKSNSSSQEGGLKSGSVHPRIQNMKALDYWNKVLEDLIMPSVLKDKISPLSTREVVEYSDKIKKHLLFYDHKLSSSFCAAANLLCQSLDDGQMEIIALGLFNVFYYREYIGIASTPAMPNSRFMDLEKFSWFYEKDMFSNVRKNMRYPKTLFNLEGKGIGRSFLPRTLVGALGNLTTSSTASVIEAFGISSTSSLAKLMYQTSVVCEEEGVRGEIKFCVQSIEDMADLVKQRLHLEGKYEYVEVLNGMSRPKPLPKSYNNEDWKIMRVEAKGDVKSNYISCHSATFLYQVYVCHYIPKTKIFSVSLESIPLRHNRLDVVVLCHTDTRMWDPNHVAFKVLGGKPGTTSVCHWSNYDALVFVKHSYVKKV